MLGTVSRWSAEQVLGLAPDAASANAARSQASPVRWPESGASEAAVWGRCQGSGKAPYRVLVDLSGPAYKCSCPSRKIPCKHALGLLLLWSAGGVDEAPEPTDVGEWLAARRVERPEPGGPVKDEAAAARRQARRAERVSAGVAELDGWLTDQVRRGLGALERGGGNEFHAVAARMVDAQASGLAAGLRRAGEVAGRGRDWPSRVLEELGLLYLLATAYGRVDELPEGLAATVRARVGFSTSAADVLASGEQVSDLWTVIGIFDQVDDQLVSRRTWLRGTRTDRPALILAFAPPGAPLDNSFAVGTAVPATLAFYPGSQALRALPVERDEPIPARRPLGESVTAALERYAQALAADPWLDRWPVVLEDVAPATVDSAWVLVDTTGDALPVRPAVDMWPLVAISAGRPVLVAGEWTSAGLRPLSCWDGERAVRL
jgi:hypothetical protein